MRVVKLGGGAAVQRMWEEGECAFGATPATDVEAEGAGGQRGEQEASTPVAITYVSLSNCITPLCFAVLSELER